MAPTLSSALTELREKGIVMCMQHGPILGRHSKCFPARYETTGERLWVKHCYGSTDVGCHELQVLCRLSNVEGLPKIICSVYIKEDGSWMYVMTTVGEHAMDLTNFVEKNMVDRDQNLPVILQSIYEITARLLARGYVQMDMKPANFVVDRKTLKVMMIDFGAVHRLVDDGAYIMQRFKGLAWAKTDIYRAPENNEHGIVPAQHATWCFGMIAYYLATGVEVIEDYDAVCQIGQTNLQRHIIQMVGYETGLTRIILRCLTIQPCIRIQFPMIYLLLTMYKKKTNKM